MVNIQVLSALDKGGNEEMMPASGMDAFSAASVKNPALYTTKDHKIYSAPSPVLDPGPDYCVVHVRANGICGHES
jgi:hypothetical protein